MLNNCAVLIIFISIKQLTVINILVIWQVYFQILITTTGTNNTYY